MNLYKNSRLARLTSLWYSDFMGKSILNVEGTLFCGQTFAWKRIGNTYQGVVKGTLVALDMHCPDSKIEGDPMLSHYFDMAWPYAQAEAFLSERDPYLASCILRDKSIHILNQDTWEVLVSFILSQNNNIKRIQRLYDTLSETFGTRLSSGWYTFPRPMQMLGVTESELRSLGLGFRAPYVLDALEHHDLLDLVEKQAMSEAKTTLMRIRGVGEKVASCVLLFGFHQMRSFPIDTWMRKVMESRYPGHDESLFAPYEALAQQYLFHAERTKGVKS